MTAVLDIETVAWDQFLVGCLVVDGVPAVTRDPVELLDWVMAMEGDVWAHNGGRYDWLWLLDQLSQRAGSHAKIYMSGSSATRIDVGQLHLRDSYRLIPMTLDAAGAIVGERKRPLGVACVCDGDCGGYCALSHDMSLHDWSCVTEYLIQDCRTLANVLDYLGRYCEDNAIVLRGTVGGTAWATAQATLELPDAEWEPSEYAQIREAMYGGRTECRVMRAEHVYQYDIRSAYPAALVATDLPLGSPRQVSGADAAAAYNDGAPGIWRARVCVPESMAPPLPWRGKNRLYFPSGEITGVWARPELEHAIDACGVAVLEWYWAYVWPDSGPIMREPNQHVWNLRAAEIERNPALAKWLKWLANSLTGKLGQDPDARAICLSTSDTPPTACAGGECLGFCSPHRCCDHRCSGRCERWDSIDPRGRIWSRPAWRMPGCAYVHWNIYLTAVTRVELHRQILHAGDDWVYSDTDSTIALRPLTRRLGDDLGEWGYDGAAEPWRCIAPKAYMAGTKIRCKGLSRITPEAWADYCRGEPVTNDRGVMGLLSAARAGESLFRRQSMVRKSIGRDGWCGGRVITNDGVTRAPQIGEIE